MVVSMAELLIALKPDSELFPKHVHDFKASHKEHIRRPNGYCVHITSRSGRRMGSVI